jgi:hypothetical protein
MSKTPISAPSARTLAALSKGGWTRDDWTWEKHTERAADCFTETGDPLRAADDWRVALATARDRFNAHDPRLACSLANHATAVAAANSVAVADKLLAEAVRAWRGAAFWVATMRLDATARSSIYHLRMELRHLDTFRRQQRNRLLTLLNVGESATRARLSDPAATPGPPDLDSWAIDAPAGYSDTRKLVGAVHLLAGIPPTGSTDAGAPAASADTPMAPTGHTHRAGEA